MLVPRIIQTLFLSLVGYSFPRLLIALGVPLDLWIAKLSFLNLEATLWGFALIFSLIMVWAEGRFNLLENLFHAARPVRLDETTTFEFIRQIESGQSLVSEFSQNSRKIPVDWQGRVVSWNASVEKIIRENLPPSELFAYRTISLRPENLQLIQLTVSSLQSRVLKLRVMMMRLLPPAWSRKVEK